MDTLRHALHVASPARSAKRHGLQGAHHRRLSLMKYESVPPTIGPGDGLTAPLPSNRDMFYIANKAWRGVETRQFDAKRGVLVSGQDIIQWILYHLKMDENPDTVIYLSRIAQEFINRRYMMRVTSSIIPHILRHRKKRVNMKFSGDGTLYDFNDVAVSQLHVVVLIQGASGLMARDRSGTSDPVCQVLLGGTQSRQTRVISKNCYPIWNEVFTFGVRDVSSQQLIFKVYDYDTASSDDFLGYARLPLSDVMNETDLEQARLTTVREERQRKRIRMRETSSQVTKSGRIDFFTTNGVRRDEVAASLGNFGDGALDGAKGLIHDVDLLFDDGAFQGAMKTLKLGRGGKSAKHHVKGTLRVGAFLRNYHPTELKVGDADNGGGFSSVEGVGEGNEPVPAPAGKAFQLYCHIYHARGIKAKKETRVGNYVPGLRWMNRVALRCDDETAYSRYVYKTSGPLWKEVLSLEVRDISRKLSRIRVYQCGQAKIKDRFVGELAIPLSLIKVVNPLCDGESKTVCGVTVNGKSLSEMGVKSPSTYHRRMMDFIDPSLQEAIDNDALLASIDPMMIPQPSMMPLTYHWGDGYTADNGEICVSLWMTPKGGSLFGDIEDTEVAACIPDGEILSIPEPLRWLCAESIVSIPLDVLRRELWGRKDSPSMLAHYEEKEFTNIIMGEWRELQEDENDGERRGAGLIRNIEYLFPASAMVSANMAYETQTIEASQDLLGGFVVNSVTKNPEVMYGKSFHTQNQFVFEWIAPRQTRVRISSQVNFLKRPAGFIAGKIESGVRKGTKESSELLVDLLSSAAGGSSKKRRIKKKAETFLGPYWFIMIMVSVLVLLIAFIVRTYII